MDLPSIFDQGFAQARNAFGEKENIPTLNQPSALDKSRRRESQLFEDEFSGMELCDEYVKKQEIYEQ